MKGLLDGYKAVVTGGSRGIGNAVAKELVAQGAIVSITCTKKNETNNDFSSCFEVDFKDLNQVQKFATALKNELKPNILINNAGIGINASFEEVSLESFSDTFSVNARAPFLFSQAVIPDMKLQAWGRIVNVNSIWGMLSREKRAAYSASKFALDGLSLALSAEVARDGILANCVAPGFINTELTRKNLSDNDMKKVIELVPVGRLGTPEEVAKFIVWLSSPVNTFICGQNIAIDGGFSRVR